MKKRIITLGVLGLMAAVAYAATLASGRGVIDVDGEMAGFALSAQARGPRAVGAASFGVRSSTEPVAVRLNPTMDVQFGDDWVELSGAGYMWTATGSGPVTVWVRGEDNGEDPDVFEIEVSENGNVVYSASGEVVHGSIDIQ